MYQNAQDAKLNVTVRLFKVTTTHYYEIKFTINNPRYMFFFRYHGIYND